jgi:hypothetical protein
MFDFVGKVGSRDGGKGSEVVGSFNIADTTNDHHGWSLHNCHGFYDLTLVHLYKILVKSLYFLGLYN